MPPTKASQSGSRAVSGTRLATITLEAAATFDLEAGADGVALPRFEMVANTGTTPMRLGGWRYPVVMDFAGLQIPSQVRPIRLNHDRTQGVGHSDRIAFEGGVLRAAGVISRETEAARDVIASARNGFPWQASVGAAVDNWQFVKDGEKANVNGVDFAGPINVIRSAVLGEISFVDLGADDHTSVRVAAMGEESTATIETEPAAATSTAEVINRAKQERLRRQGIKAHVEEALSFVGCDDEAIGRIGLQAEAEGWPIEKAEVELMRATRPRVAAPRPDGAPNMRVLEAALCLYAGIDGEKLAADRDYGEDLVTRAWKFRNHGLRGTIAAYFEMCGIRMPHGTRDLYNVVLENRSIRAEGFSTVNLPGIIGNVANKLLLDAFVTVNATYDKIANQADFANFHVHSIYRLDHLGGFELVPKDGEIKHGALSQTAFSNKIDTYGQMLTLPRQDIINDDLNAFKTITAQLARKARLAVEKALYGVIMEASDVFYTVAQGNRLVGALGVVELGAAEAALTSMADAGGDPIYAQPRFILVPPALKFLGDQLWTSQWVNDFTASRAKPTDNPFKGRFEVVSSPYLQLPVWPGNSPSTWYLLADPAVLGAFQVAYLDGRRQPTIETADAEFNTLGLSFRCYWDFGVAQLDGRGVIKNTAT